jgi:heme/copper-type cytochrome/quinol oxidase subunit 2
MVETRKEEIKREIILALMVLTIFISLVVTWTVLGAVESYTQENSAPRASQVWNEESGNAMVALTILPDNSLEGGGDK